MKKLMLLIFIFFPVLSPSVASSDAVSSNVVGSLASRGTGESTTYYATLNEAFAAAKGLSPEEPDEITLLEDCILSSPILIDDSKHIRLIAGSGNRTIWRGSANLENPLFRVTGEGATLAFGRPRSNNMGREGQLFIDGGNLRNPPISALSPLVVVNGLDSKVILHDGATLQNNRNTANAPNTSLYQNGSGVFIRALRDIQERQPEFIMKGGTIRGKANETNNVVPCGGGVLIAGFGLFTMEGGVIAANRALLVGGGFHTGSRGSFRKTGGIIYGEDAAAELQNRAIDGTYSRPPIYHHAISVPAIPPDTTWWFGMSGTVNETVNLTFTGAEIGQTASFGANERWNRMMFIPVEAPIESGPPTAAIAGIAAGIALFAAALGFALALAIVKRKKKQASAAFPEANGRIPNIPPGLSPREQEIFYLLFSDITPKEMAYKYKTSTSAVNKHISNVYRKLNIHTRMELIAKFGKPS
jgi:DNA-binding CsgD family transcriptional regulator